MSKFLKLGATALAMALSITMIAPISAKAEVSWKLDGEDIVYTNEDTKESKSTKDYIALGYDDLRSEVKVRTIATNSYNQTISLSTTNDVAKFENFKSNKKALKVKVIEKYEYTDPEPTAHFRMNYWNSDATKGYYRDVNGKTVEVTDFSKLAKGNSNGRYTIRLYTKKAGTYKLKFDAKLKDGSTVSKSIKIIATETGPGIKSVSFGGKLLFNTANMPTYDRSDRVYDKGYGEWHTSAKSGKLTITMNENFKLKKIEIGKPSIEKKTLDNGDVGTFYTKKTSGYDYDMYEEDNYTWKKVKNGKKIKLYKVDVAEVIDDPDDAYNPKTTTYEEKNTDTPTAVRVTYKDKKNKTTHRVTFFIYKTKK